MNTNKKIAVVIPAYKVESQILSVIESIPSFCNYIIVVIDGCPDNTYSIVSDYSPLPEKNQKIIVLQHQKNRGVGAAMKTGYLKALELNVDIVVKLDGDGQMDSTNIEKLVKPIIEGVADYAKGNRFYEIGYLVSMPKIRLFGNSICSFLSKITSGYWSIMDPTNGFTAIHYSCLSYLQIENLDDTYFFESDMLYQLSLVRAVVMDIPMKSCYQNEDSNLSILRTIRTFPLKYSSRFLRRIFYTYYIRDFNLFSLQFFFAILFLISGTFFGLYHWYISYADNVLASSGTVMVAALLIILGVQLLLSSIMYDILNNPSKPIQN